VEEKLKTRIMLALGIFSLILLIVAFQSCNGRRIQEKRWRTEMAQRLDAEEKAQKASQEEAALSTQLRKTREELQKSDQELEAVNKKLLQERMVNENLKAELDKLSKLKDALEEDLKEALVNGGKTAAKQPKK
jgi:hypothetical protein